MKNSTYIYLFRLFSTTALIIYLSGLFIPSVSMSEVPILQPGAPGEPTRELDAETAIAIANTSYTAADIDFMQGMIIHHYQAF